MQTTVLFDENFGFFKIYGESSRTGRGFEPVRTFFGQGGGVNFLGFCADVFYGRPLKRKSKK